MAHVVLFAFHGLGINRGKSIVARFTSHDFLGQGRVVEIQHRLLLRLLRLDEHLPETLRSQIVEALVGRGVTENIGNSLAKLFDSNGKSVSLVVLNHLEEGITGEDVSN